MADNETPEKVENTNGNPEETKKIEAEKPEEKKEKKKSSIFITEEDRFDIKVRFYREGDSKTLFVEDVDDEFDPKKEDVEEFTMTFKYPSQRDYALIKGSSNIVTQLDDLPPSLTKAIAMKVRDVIKYDGIL